MSEEGKIPNPEMLTGFDSGLNRRRGTLSRYSSALLLFLVFCAVALVGLFVIRDLRSADVEAQKMYAGSVLGLHRIGDLQYDAQETRRSTFYALSTTDSNLHVKYADQSREADHRVTEGINEYLAHAQTPSELDVGKRLQRDWSAYLNIRDEVLASILEGSTKEAVDLDLAGGVQSFERVRQDLEEIERLYDETASRQLAKVDDTSRRTIVRVSAALGITLIFVLASVLAIQRIRIMGAIEVAKLQMEFVASVSHELRTPLTVISSAADNIADGLVKEPANLKKYGVAIQNQSRHMNELVNQILLFASTKGRKNNVAAFALQVSEIVPSAVHETLESTKTPGFNVELEIEPDLPVVRGDPAALARCLQNIITNAVKYSGSNRWIGIKALLAESRSQKEIRIIVQDRGIGIARSALPHVFEPFYRSPEVVAQQIHGTGLGLSISKSIAESMGGRLTVVSELGSGSTFTLHLPVVQDPQFDMPVEAGANERTEK